MVINGLNVNCYLTEIHYRSCSSVKGTRKVQSPQLRAFLLTHSGERARKRTDIFEYLYTPQTSPGTSSILLNPCSKVTDKNEAQRSLETRSIKQRESRRLCVSPRPVWLQGNPHCSVYCTCIWNFHQVFLVGLWGKV